MRDVRDYKVTAGDEGQLGGASPFNVKEESVLLRDFTRDEVAGLYAQHTAATGQVFAPDAVDLAFQLTCGQPWLVNALAREMVDEHVPDRSVTLVPAHVRAARDAIVLRQDTHLDSLAKRLRDDQVRAVIESITTGSSLGAVPDGDQRYAMDLGLVHQAEGGVLEIANPIYREIFQGRLSATAVACRAIDRWREENASRLFLGDELDAALSAERGARQLGRAVSRSRIAVRIIG
ncbi:hypothetical protein [Sorangium sp. So ce394]|uniref:hypothetical protein n=1 Tax=Sorangium sp. So ce394 TaxID=3133310 RepID=UPI003F5BEE39